MQLHFIDAKCKFHVRSQWLGKFLPSNWYPTKMRTENCGLPDSSSRMMQNKLDEEYQTGEYNEYMYNSTTDGQWQSINNLQDKEIGSDLGFFRATVSS